MKTPKIIIAMACLLMLPLAALSQLPSPTYGWNLGNTLEPPTGEGSWGPPATQNLINGVAGAGFNTVRLPVAWNSHANQSTYQIDAAWMARVKQVVDWCYAKNLYVIINSHWDNGWLENNITGSVDSTINAKQQASEASKKQGASMRPLAPEQMVERWLVMNAKVHLNPGNTYGLGGADHMRMNIATSRKTLELALGNIAAAVNKL